LCPQDIGFDGISPEAGTDDNVINRYFDVYFPRAIETANALKAQNAGLSYVWTTQVCSLAVWAMPSVAQHPASSMCSSWRRTGKQGFTTRAVTVTAALLWSCNWYHTIRTIRMHRATPPQICEQDCMHG